MVGALPELWKCILLERRDKPVLMSDVLEVLSPIVCTHKIGLVNNVFIFTSVSIVSVPYSAATLTFGRHQRSRRD